MFFVTAYLGEPHGSAKSARDFAMALLAVHDDVHIVSPHVADFGTTAAGHDLVVPVWHRSPHRSVRRSKWRKLLAAAAPHGLRRLNIGRAMTGHIVVVNGWASYGYWKALGATTHKHSAIIVRESPRHFAGDDRSETLRALISGFAEFDRLIFVSDRLRQEWGTYAELAEKPAFYLPNCCEEEEIVTVKNTDRQLTRGRLGVRVDDFMLICPGTIEQRKGQDIVLHALPEILAAIPNVRLVLLGNAGTQWGRRLEVDIDMGKYGERVLRVPAQPSALEYLHAADALLLPSRAEAMPRTILEGMALGMPIISTSVDGVPELIEDGVSGWLFDPAEPARMIGILSQVVSRPEEAERLGLAAERRYKQLFSRRHQIERAGFLLTWLNAG